MKERERETCATKNEVIPNLLRKALAISEVGDREAMATSIPLSLRADKIPMA